MTLLPVECSHCHTIYYRQTQRINEALKFGWKQYCSLKCQILAKNKQITLKCGNPLCNKTFKRKQKEISVSGICYCSKSCSAIVNNSKSPKRLPKIRICLNCKKEFIGHRKYCSSLCRRKNYRFRRSVFPKEKIIEEVKKFYLRNGRIPFKKEYYHWKAARARFGTWNKAIEAAGFDPNPVKFAKKYLAKDGHVCDSLSEKIIDDWLFRRRITHERNVHYLKTKFTADFKVKDVFIEFFGLKNELKTYDRLMKKKLRIIKTNNLKLITINPEDIFPTSRLGQILAVLLPPT